MPETDYARMAREAQIAAQQPEGLPEWITRYLLPNTVSLARGERAPPMENFPAIPGKIPEIGDRRYQGVLGELAQQGVDLMGPGGAIGAPIKAGIKAAVPFLKSAATGAGELAGSVLGNRAVQAGAGVLGAGAVLSPDEAEAKGRGVLKAFSPALDFWAHEPPRILPGDYRVSTRFPNAKTATENPLTHHLNIGLPEITANPEMLAQHTGLLSDYPGLARLKEMTPEQAAEAYVEHARGNLNYLFEHSPQIMQQRSPRWYEGAHEFSDALAERWGVPRRSVSGGIAGLSPQKDWFQNASLAERAGDVFFGPNRPFTTEMAGAFQARPALHQYSEALDRIRGKSWDQMKDADPLDQALWVRLYDEAHNPRNFRIMTPEGRLGGFKLTGENVPHDVAWGGLDPIDTAMRSFGSGGDINLISPALGTKHKVRSFYNNIELPWDTRFGDVTGDTHHVGAALMMPVSGTKTPAVAHNLGTGLETKNYPPEGFTTAKSSSVSGIQGTYGYNAEAARRSAVDQGMLARQVQSGTWEPIRQLFPSEEKSATLTGVIGDIWREYDRGAITANQARRRIFSVAGGIEPPSWAERGLTTFDPRRASTYR